jgi:hypothetical protein
MRAAAVVLLAAAAVALSPVPAAAAGGDVVFDGGSATQRGQVKAALGASAFPWDIVPGPVVVHIRRGVDSHAGPNEIWLDADLLDAGRFAWGVVQHEFGHVVDFALLTDAMRDKLHARLQGTAWWTRAGEGHAEFDCERFADLVAWAYWPSTDNAMKPQSPRDEGGQVSPAAFRATLASLLPELRAVRMPAAAGGRR